MHRNKVYLPLRPPGGAITVFSTPFTVLLSYGFTLDPYNPMVLYSFTIEILTDSTIIKNYSHSK